MSAMMASAPYPPDTRAKGWRFELDMERARQSDTWTLTPAEARPWLLMLWATAWEQTPCGSLPDDDALIAARIGMPPRLFQKHRAMLLRKWWKAEDGRLYHDVLVQRVREMMERRRKESDRKALARLKKSADVRDCPEDVPRDSGGTPAGFHPRGDTGTGTGTGEETYGTDVPAVSARASPVDKSSGQPRAEVRIAMSLRKAGIQANASHPVLMALVAAGATEAEFVDMAPKAVGKSDPFAYLLGAVEGNRRRAKETVGVVHVGPLQADVQVAADTRAEEELRRQAAQAQRAVPPPESLRRLTEKLQRVV